ncbi:hypothetical protein BJY52DRAFT_1231737 [Lactarius psammicola]|nr:hypothetical protein BJY52DRAFT_1231737 [Lactarius psammicola]
MARKASIVSEMEARSSGYRTSMMAEDVAAPCVAWAASAQAADTCSRIIANVMAELYALRDGTVSFNKKDADRKYIKFTHKWSARNTFYHLHQDEVMLEVEQMSENQQRYSNLATRWSDNAPPPHIQARMASSISGKIIQDFQAQLFKTCGIQYVVLTAHEHENGSIITGIDEANNLLDGGTCFLKYCPNWKDAPLFREWQKYAKMCFRGGYVSGKKKATIPWANSNDPSSSNANHSALLNSDDNSTEDKESENFNLKVSSPHSLSSPQGSGSFQGGRRYTSTPSSPIDTQCRSTLEMEWTLSPDHILEERQERQEHDKDYDSGPDDSGTFQSSPQGSFDESDHGKWQVKITERAKYMNTGRSVGGINTHFLQRTAHSPSSSLRLTNTNLTSLEVLTLALPKPDHPHPPVLVLSDAPWFRQWCASGCSKMKENTPTYQSVKMYPSPMKAVQKWTCTLQSVEIPPGPVSIYGDMFYSNHWLASGRTKVAE